MEMEGQKLNVSNRIGFDSKFRKGDLLSTDELGPDLPDAVVRSCARFSIDFRGASRAVPVSCPISEQLVSPRAIDWAERVHLKGMGTEQTAIVDLRRNSSVSLHLFPEQSRVGSFLTVVTVTGLEERTLAFVIHLNKL